MKLGSTVLQPNPQMTLKMNDAEIHMDEEGRNEDKNVKDDVHGKKNLRIS
jgi:hypothetical protein